MTDHEIERGIWADYFNHLSNANQGRQVLIEIIGEELGDQIEEDWSLFEGLSFDFHSDTLFVRTPILEHSIACPQNIVVREDGLIRAIGIRDADGHLQIIHFRNAVLIEGH